MNSSMTSTNMKNQGIATSVPKSGVSAGVTASGDVECQSGGFDRQPTTATNDSNDDSFGGASGDSGDQLLGGGGGTDGNSSTYYPTTTSVLPFLHKGGAEQPPTLLETAIVVGFTVAIVLMTGVAMFVSSPHQRPIPTQFLEGANEYVRNLTNNEIYQGETVPIVPLLLLSIFCPGAIQFAYGLAKGRKGDYLRTICTYCVSFCLTMMVTEFVKQYVGYLRPVFFHKCEPDNEYQTCTGTDWDESELRKSFVSGHASFAFCGGVLFSKWLEQTIGVSSVEIAIARPIQVQQPEQQQQETLPMTTNQQQQSAAAPTTKMMMVSMGYRQPPGLRKIGSVLAMSPMIVSIWIACTRVVDNVHFPADIVGGAVLGATIAAYCHPLWYPDPRYLP